MQLDAALERFDYGERSEPHIRLPYRTVEAGSDMLVGQAWRLNSTDERLRRLHRLQGSKQVPVIYGGAGQ